MNQPETYGKRPLKRRVAAAVLLIALLSAAVLLLLPHSKVSEGIQKQAAKIRHKEYIPKQRDDISATMAFAQKDSLHALFRSSFRFHHQCIGTADFPDSSRLLMISEPTPFFSEDSLPAIFEGFRIEVEKKRHRIGYDGYICDLLVVIGNATSENMERRIRRLSKALYFSDYKCPVIPLQQPGKRRYFTKGKLDYRLSLNEINNWFLEEPETFMQLDDTTRLYTLQELLDKKLYGRYFSSVPGFVTWVIPKHRDLSEQLHEIRPFTLDADLILAAISDSASLAIIGREREAALDELPPLQVESILLLAAVKDKELSQSLDINDLMAGKMGNGQDWCPTYLSRELENTEPGDLLTMTDIILKDWSESGTIRESGYRYPHPGYYPFPKPLFEWLGVEQLVYNWHTDDAMFAIDRDGKTIYAPNRTGSLPVSYFLSQERSTSAGRRYEQKAYSYFAGCGNTDLARVVQYTLLYQLFIDNDIRYEGELHNAFPENKPHLLVAPVQRLLEQITALSEDSIRSIADSVTRQQFEGFHRARLLKQIADADEKYGLQHSEEEIEDICRRVLHDKNQALCQQFRQVRQMVSSLSENERTRLVRHLAYPRGTRIRDAESYRTYKQAETVKKLLHSMGKNHMALIGTELSDVRNRYCAQLADKAAPYLKTPSCVVTFHDFYTTGGHNISSKIHRVHSMTGYRPASSDAPAEYYPAPQPEKAAPAPGKAAPVPEKATTAPGRAAPVPGKTAPVTKKTATAPVTTKAATAPAKSTTSGIRSRSSVISTQARTQRGL